MQQTEPTTLKTLCRNPYSNSIGTCQLLFALQKTCCTVTISQSFLKFTTGSSEAKHFSIDFFLIFFFFSTEALQNSVVYFVCIMVSPRGSAWGCWIQYKQKWIKLETIKSKQRGIRNQRRAVPRRVYTLGRWGRHRRERKRERREIHVKLKEWWHREMRWLWPRLYEKPEQSQEMRPELPRPSTTRQPFPLCASSLSFSSSLLKAENVSAEHLQFPKFLLLFPILGFWSQTIPSLSGLTLT